MDYFTKRNKKLKVTRQKTHLKLKKTLPSGEKLINATENLRKNARVNEIKLWMRIVVGAMCVIFVLLTLFIYISVQNGMFGLNFLKKQTLNTDITVQSESDVETDSESADERLLRYVNSKNKIDSDYMPQLFEYKGVLLSQDMRTDLEQMINDSIAEGIELKITCGYVTAQQQQEKYETLFNYYKNELNYSLVKAQASTMRDTPDGESSEYRTGLLINFENSEYNDFSQSEDYAWLYRNSVNYGFILRYPKDKVSYTGMNPSYSQFRYVGKENARKMRVLGMCLEEYNDYLDSQ